jgi:undecaprenyl-diphosphatase
MINLRLYLNRMHQLDTNMCVAVNHTSQYRVIRHFFRGISRLGDGIFWYTLMILILIFQGAEAVIPVLHMAIAGVIGTFIYKWLKGKTLRPRPYQVRQDIRLTGKALDKFSFPSGHTLHAVVFTWVALSYFPNLIGLLIPFTLCVALSRVVLGLHYPSDVLAGALIGGFIASVSLMLV